MRRVTLFVLFLVACSSGTDRSIDEAEALIEKGRFRDAVAVIEKLEGRDSTPRIYYLLGFCYARMKNVTRMERYFDLTLERDSSYRFDIIETYTLLGKEYFRNSQPDLATRAFERVLELSPYADLQEYFYVMGDYYYERDNHDKAVDYYHKGLLFVPDFRRVAQAKRNIVQSYCNLGKNVDALNLCDQFLEEGRDENLLYQKGTIAYELAQESFEQDSLEKCMNYLNKVIEAGHPLVLQDDTYFMLGKINLRIGEYEKAKINFESVLQLNPYGESQLARDARERLKLIEGRDSSQ